jgi:phosphatidylinositol alpha-1,6-mannosyltransferase
LPEGLMALALKYWMGVPYLCYAHGEDLNYASSSRELSWLQRRVLRNCDVVIASSRNAARLLQQEWGLPQQRVELLYPGVDTEQFVPAASDPGVRKELGWQDRPVVLTAGRLQKRKGHDQMILAIRSIRQVLPAILYAIVGDGEEREPLMDLVVRQGVAEQVQFLGEVSDEQLVQCYQQCDLFVLPNRQIGPDIEGFGIVLLEAQACGKAVVAGDSGGTAETMLIPQTGLVVPCDGPDQLASVVIRLLGDAPQCERMGVTARQWVVDHFDWSGLSRQAGRIFERLSSPDHSAAPMNIAF